MIDSGGISESQLSEVVQISRGIIQSHLGYIRSSIAHLCLRQGLSLVDLSYDCIAEAFARDAGNSFRSIHDFLGSLEKDLGAISNEELFLAYKSFLIRIAEAQLARLYGQSDPSGSRIHRNVRDCLKDSAVFAKRRDFRGVVLSPLKIDPLDHLGQYPPDELERCFMQDVSSKHSIPQMLEHLHEILAMQSEFRRSIPLLDIVQMFKRFFQSDFNPETSIDHPSLDGMSEFDLQQMRHELENVLKERIVLTYLIRGKVTDVEGKAMLNALQDILDGWFTTGDSPDSLYSCLSSRLPISPETYEQDFRPKMEYLLKIARQELSSRMMREI